ncbi:EAL domain-containing protein [Sphingomonas sp. MMS24-JH45]
MPMRRWRRWSARSPFRSRWGEDDPRRRADRRRPRGASGAAGGTPLRRAAEALARARGGEGATTQYPHPTMTARRSRPSPPTCTAPSSAARSRCCSSRRWRSRPVGIAGVEALARWRHPRLGALGAASLLAAADRAGLGVALSAHIQAVALARVAAWPASLSALRVAVNVTAADVARADFADGFLTRVAASGVDPARVTAEEITEGGLIDDLDAVAPPLERLRAAGCRVAVDDFGTGYSSLAYLATLPLDYLKIDRSLVQDVVADRRRRAVVEGVLAIAAALSLRRSRKAWRPRRSARCWRRGAALALQGFLCAAPIDDAALVALVSN